MCKISVIVPVYNVEKYIKRCVDSILNQSYKNFELILIDDGSTDSSASICDEYAERYDNIKTIHKSNEGVSSARNFGLKQACGEYIAFIDSDDWIEADMAQECYAFANKQRTDILTMDYFVNVKKKECLRKQKPKSLNPLTILHQILTEELFGSVWLRIIRKGFYDKYPTTFPEHMGYCEDVLFWAFFLQLQPKIDYLPKAFYHYVQDNNNSITRNYTIEKYNERKKFIYELKKILPNHFKNDINMAAFYVKMEALRNGFLTYSDYTSFEPTNLRTLLYSKQPWILNIFFIIRSFFQRGA